MVTRLFRSFRSLRSKHQGRRIISHLFGGDNKPQFYSARRILPYRSAELYKLITDIDSYSSFVPFCIYSKVVKRYPPDTLGIKWPAEAYLTIGWLTIEETFTSRIFCIPESVVEALSGDAVTSLPENELLCRSPNIHSSAVPNSLFHYLRTKWTFKPYHNKDLIVSNPQRVTRQQSAKQQTEVSVDLDFKLRSSFYTSLITSLAPNILVVMIDAFQKRAYNCFGNK